MVTVHWPNKGARRAALGNLAVAGFVLWFEALLVWLSPEVPGHLVLVVAVLGTFGLFLHLPWLVTRRWFAVAVGVLGILFLVRLGFFPPAVADRGFIIVPQLPTIVLAEFVFSCLCLLIWRWKWPEPLPMAVPCVALITSVFALNKTLPIGMQTSYAWLAAFAVLMPTALAVAAGHVSSAQTNSRSRGAHMVVIGVWGAVLMMTLGLTEAWSRWLPDAKTWFAGNVGRAAIRQQRVTGYVTSGSLIAIRLENADNPNAVALQVYADHQPGYLAGRVFDQYSHGNWSIGAEQDRRGGKAEQHVLKPLRRVPSIVGDDHRNLSTFARDARPAPATIRRLAIENDARRGRVFFTPLGWRYLQAAGPQLRLDEFDIVRSGISVYMPYVVYADATKSVQPLATQLRRRLLTPPRGLDPRVRQLAGEICRTSRTPFDKIQAIEGYFQDNYQYSLEPVKVPAGVDPLNHFLLAKHPAHCEFFASGAVALLRLQGVPARYATGYRVMQLDDRKKGRWVARNREAHAWAEAFDEQRQRWVVVEATPGFVSPTDDSATTDVDGAGAFGSGFIFTPQNANAILLWWKQQPLAVKLLLLALLLTITVLLGAVCVRRTRRNRNRKGRPTDPRVRHWLQSLRRMDRRLQRRGVIRARSETLHQFAQRLRSANDGHNAWQHACASWYVTYANRRFRSLETGPPPLPSKRMH